MAVTAASLPAAAGNAIRHWVEQLGLCAFFLGAACSFMPALLFKSDRFSRRRTVEALSHAVLLPLPVLTGLAVSAGFVLGFGVARALDIAHVEAPMLLTLRHALMREVMPLLVGVFIAGRSAVGLSVRLGRMTAVGETDALRLMGIDPASYVLPAHLLAFTVSAGVLFAWGVGIAHLVAAISLEQTDAIPMARYFSIVFTPSAWHPFWSGLLRVESFAVLTFSIAAAEGSGATRDPNTLETVARRTFVASLLAIFVTAALFAWLDL